MKTLGLIGGIGPESTIEYYRLIIAAYREQVPRRAYPSIIVNSINLQQYLDWINANDLESFATALVSEIERLTRVGADFGALCSNTPHIVFDELQRRSSLRAGIEGIILGGTELPLLLRPDTFIDGQHNGMRFFDTTRIHVDRLVEELLK